MTQLEIEIARHGERIKDLENVTGRIEKKLDNFQAWLVGLMGGVIASLVLLIANLVMMGGH